MLAQSHYGHNSWAERRWSPEYCVQLSSDWGWLDCKQVFSKPNIGYETVDILTLQGEAGVCWKAL